MTNNFSCEQLHQDILTQSTQTSLNNHIANTVVHVTEADHTNIDKISGIEKSLNTISTKVSELQDNVDNNDYVTNDELISKDYITKQSVMDYYVQKSQLKDIATKDYVDDKISNIDITGNTPKISISASTDSSIVNVDVVEQSTGSNNKQDFKFKFTGFNDIQGGGVSTDSTYTIVSIFTTSDSNTTAPDINQRLQRIPTGWGTESIGPNKYLWRSQGRKDKNNTYIAYADYTYWTTPECCGIINGDTSEVGVDTDTIDYIYWNTNIDTNIVAPTFTVEESKAAFKTDNFIKDTVNGVSRLWYNHPNGVTSNSPYEYASFATYDADTKTWSKYSTPYIFSHYGIDGKDGDGVEYIYILTNTESTPTISYNGVTDDDYQQDDFIPAGGWTDNPQQTDMVNKYQYVAVRKKDGSTNTWGKFSTPTLWSIYSKPEDPKDPADVYSSVVYYKYGTLTQTMITETERKTKDIPKGWSKNPTSSDVNQYLYMISSDTVNNVTVADKDGFYWSDAMRLTGEPGPQGTSGTGADGADINYIYARTKESTKPTTPTFTVGVLEPLGQYDQDDTYYGNITWYDHPQGVDSEYQYEWISIAKKPAGIDQVFGSYNNPVLWSKYGDRGIDGDTIEYIYKRTTVETIPDTPVKKYDDNRDDNIPDGWTDDPSGVSEDWPFEYCSTRTKHCTIQNPEGIWEPYKTPFLWAKYGKDGEKGEPGKPGEPMMINTRKWEDCKVGDKFYQGANGDTQVDVVYYNKEYYRCVKSYTLEDKATQDPTNTTYWVVFESYSNIATELLLAEEASINNLLLNYAKAKDADGNVTVEIDGNTGSLKANKATLTEAYVEGAVQASTIGYDLAIPWTIQEDMSADGSFSPATNTTWKYTSVGPALPTAALQLLDCKQSVYMFQQTSSLPNQSAFIGNSGGFIVYAIPSPSIAKKTVLDLYFKYDKEYITEDGKQLFNVYLAIVDPELGLSMDNKKVVPESWYGCYTANSYHSTNPSTTLMNICSYNKTVRPINGYFITLNKKWLDSSQQTTVDCNLPSHIKLLSDGKSTWYILEIDELF